MKTYIVGQLIIVQCNIVEDSAYVFRKLSQSYGERLRTNSVTFVVNVLPLFHVDYVVKDVWTIYNERIGELDYV